MSASLVGSEMCIRDRRRGVRGDQIPAGLRSAPHWRARRLGAVHDVRGRLASCVRLGVGGTAPPTDPSAASGNNTSNTGNNNIAPMVP
eukprot:4234944-Alexandrium_andersonii.AAC.1